MKSMQRIAFGIAIAGAIMVSLHSSAVWLYHCASSSACVATVYFGLSESVSSLPTFSSHVNVAESAPMTIAGTSVLWSDIHQIVFIVGLYALLLGGMLIVLFKIIEPRHQNIFARHKSIRT